jgi:hypothetical protein
MEEMEPKSKILDKRSTNFKSPLPKETATLDYSKARRIPPEAKASKTIKENTSPQIKK